MRVRRLLVAGAALAAVLAVVAGRAPSRHEAVPAAGASPHGLSGGASSIDELVDRMLGALERRDGQALDELRVTESEYREWIVPGSVEPGARLQALGDEASRYFWETLDTKSRFHRQALLQGFGGRKLEVVERSFEKGSKQFANHVAHRRLVLRVRDEGGREEELHTGSIAEVDGRFKMISFIRD